MFEATLAEASLLKKVIDAVKDLVSDANFDCSTEGIQLQAMDTSHVALVSLFIQADGFTKFRCDRSVSLGINLASLTKILKCANPNDKLTLRADDGSSTLTILFSTPEETRVSVFTLKLMNLEQERLGIPPQEYQATVKLPSGEFQRISRDLSVMGDTVAISVKKDEIKFAASGDIGDGNISLRQGGSADSDDLISIEIAEPVTSTFALKYFSQFSKATSLSSQVTLQLNPQLPLVIQYSMVNVGFIRFYLAPKLDDKDEGGAAAPSNDVAIDEDRDETKTEVKEEKN